MEYTNTNTNNTNNTYIDLDAHCLVCGRYLYGHPVYAPMQYCGCKPRPPLDYGFGEEPTVKFDKVLKDRK